jgi:phage repressor protein C with HTH and peptisase S24 domain
MVNHWTAGRKNMSTPSARKIEETFDLPEFWMDTEHDLHGGGAPITGQSEDLIKRLLPEKHGNVVTWETPEDLEPDSDRVWIDRYDYRFSAGTGVIQWEIRQKKALPFDIGFFKALGVRPQDCKLAQVHGRSMEPYLFHRDTMMICSSRVRVKDGLIYAIIFEDEPLVKQIFKEPDGALRLHSYNPEFPDKLLHADQLAGLQIAGEVVYRSGSGPAGGN